eukprot:366458-Chlamydomonas_euryale.AAC.7
MQSVHGICPWDLAIVRMGAWEWRHATRMPARTTLVGDVGNEWSCGAQPVQKARDVGNEWPYGAQPVQKARDVGNEWSWCSLKVSRRNGLLLLTYALSLLEGVDVWRSQQH